MKIIIKSALKRFKNILFGIIIIIITPYLSGADGACPTDDSLRSCNPETGVCATCLSKGSNCQEIENEEIIPTDGNRRIAIIETVDKKAAEKELLETLTPNEKMFYDLLNGSKTFISKDDIQNVINTHNFPENLRIYNWSYSGEVPETLNGKVYYNDFIIIEYQQSNSHRRIFLRKDYLGVSGFSYKIDFDVPMTWMNGDIERQFLEHFNNPNNQQGSAIGAIDFAVALTPFLGTADLIVNQGDFKGACLSATGDLLWGLKLISSAVKVGKAAKVTVLVTSCTADLYVVGTAGVKLYNNELTAFEAGDATLSLIGLILAGRDLKIEVSDIIANHKTKKIITETKPDASCQVCKAAGCRLPNTHDVSGASNPFKFLDGIDDKAGSSSSQLAQMANSFGWVPGKEKFALVIQPTDTSIMHWAVIHIDKFGKWTRRNAGFNNSLNVGLGHVTDNLGNLNNSLFFVLDDLDANSLSKLNNAFNDVNTVGKIKLPNLSCARDAMATIQGTPLSVTGPNCKFFCQSNYEELIANMSTTINGNTVPLKAFTTSQNIQETIDSIISTDPKAAGAILTTTGSGIWAFTEIIKELLESTTSESD